MREEEFVHVGKVVVQLGNVDETVAVGVELDK